MIDCLPAHHYNVGHPAIPHMPFWNIPARNDLEIPLPPDPCRFSLPGILDPGPIPTQHESYQVP